jgi:hypothetical protein
MEARTCQTCRYMEIPKGDYPECHRYPPFDRRFPIVEVTEWCGEWMMMKAGKRPG